jgi:hypothetical protein
MGKDAALARKKAAECMAQAAKDRTEERRHILRAMARCWMTLANHFDRLEGTRAKVRPAKPRGRSG